MDHSGRRSKSGTHGSHRIKTPLIRSHYLETLEPRLVLDSTVVFNEIMYNPVGEDAGLEWIELHNQMSVDMDISGWRLDGGVRYDFPEGTIVSGDDYLVIASDPAALLASSRFAGALGPFSGRLNNGGEELLLLNNIDSFVTRVPSGQPIPITVLSTDNVGRRVMDRIDYDDDEPWPIAPDGSGVSLAKLDEDRGSGETSNWTSSEQIDGTPGKQNFVPPGTLVFDELVSVGHPVRAMVPLSGSLGESWREPSFDDSNWTSGTTGVGFDSATTYKSLFGLDLDNPPNGQAPVQMQNLQQTIYLRVPFQLDSVVSQYDTLLLRMKYDDGFVAYINGVEVAQANAPGRDGNNAPLNWVSGATASHRDSQATQFVDFDISDYRDAFVAGSNTLAIHGLNVRAQDNDLLLLPELLGGTAVKPSIEVPLTFNEISAANGEDFWLELSNYGAQSIDLSGIVITGSGDAGGDFVFPPASEIIPPGGFLEVSGKRLGFQPAIGDKLFLYSHEKREVLDAARVEGQMRGRAEQLDGRWQFPASPTPGAPNRFHFQDQIVINEIMYHGYPDRGTPAQPPQIERVEILPLDADGWRYRESWPGLDADWATQPHAEDEVEWFTGRGPLGFSVEVEDQLSTKLRFPVLNNPPLTTYYFETDFTFDRTANPYQLVLRHFVDDGAIFYLNGEEIYRTNMPARDTTADTTALDEVRVPELSENLVLPEAQLRDGTNRLSVEVHQVDTASFDVVFGATLAVHEEVTPSTPATPFQESSEEWIELYNRSETQTVDMAGWKLTRGIGFEFPIDTLIAPKEYVVIAKDASALASKYPAIASRILGDFEGRLSNSGESLVLVDSNGNLVDEVRYFDDGRWPSSADGGGASLELRNPSAENSKAEAWRASDQSPQTSWQTYSYRGVAEDDGIGNNIFHEFVLGLLDEGEVLLDDVSVIEEPDGAAIEFIQNGDFQEDLIGDTPNTWRLIGTHGDHGRSVVVVDPEDPRNHVLHLVATGPTEDKHNQASTTYVDRERVRVGTEYEISFRAKWLSGSNQVNSRLYFNYLQKTTLIDVPGRHGTPASVNSRWEQNLGPTYENLQHRPVVPVANQDVTVSVFAQDPDQVESLMLIYSVDESAPVAVDMSHHGSGSFTGVVPGQPGGSIVQFFIQGTDKRGAASAFPMNGKDARALFAVSDGRTLGGELRSLRVIMTSSDTAFMYRNINRMSNDRRGATVIYDEREVFYDVGVRIKGSAFGRNNDRVAGLSIRFHPDHRFRGVHKTLSIERAANPKEIVAKHMLNRAAGGLATFYDDVAHIVMPRNRDSGPALLAMARTSDVYLDSLHAGGGSTPVYNLELLYSPQGTVDRSDPQSAKLNFPYTHNNGRMDIADFGDDKETYRWNFQIRNARGRDDYQPLIALAQSFSLSGEQLEHSVDEVIDVDQWMRTFAMLSLNGNDDVYSRFWEHNFRMYVRPDDGKIVAVPWDLDRAFGLPATSAGPWGVRNNVGTRINLANVIEIPSNTRLFWGHVLDITNTTANEQYMERWTGHYGDLLGTNFRAELTYVKSRATTLERQMPEAVEFQITSDTNNEITTSGDTLEIQGQGWINVRHIRLLGSEKPLVVDWVDDKTWRARVSEWPDDNLITLEAMNHQGNVVGSDSVKVIDTAFIPRAGDSNADRQFDQLDIVLALQGNRYLSGQPATFAEGDWNRDGVFDQADIVSALQTGNYLAGPYAVTLE